VAVGYASRLAGSRWPLVGRREELDAVADALADVGCQGVLVCGPAGVGKTRLAEECLAAAQQRGRAGGRATATAAAAGVPLGALVPLLPEAGGGSDPVVLFNGVATSFRARAGDAPFVLLVDDVHLLDLTSALLIGQMLDAGGLFVLGTLRTGEPVPPDVAAWWRGERMIRIDLADLPPDGVDSLLHLALGGPVTAVAVDEVWAASRGNPLFVRELVLGAWSAGSLVEDSGVWRLVSPLQGTARLTDLVMARLGAADASAEPALELLAVAEPVGLADLEALVGAGTVEGLERSGLIEVRAERRRQLARLTHPLYGEVLRAQMATSTRRRLLVARAARVAGHGARRREDPLRIATWRLEATGTADAGLLLTAARLARYAYDLAQVVRLARAALADLGPGPDRVEAQLLLGEALLELGEFTDAEAVLAEAESAAAEERQLVQVVAMRVRTLWWGLLRPDDALGVNRAARERVASREAHEELLADEAILLMFSGHPVEALRVLEALGPGVDLRTRVLRAIPEAGSLFAVGRCETAIDVARRGLTDHTELGDQLAIAHPGAHVINQVYALQEAGRIAEATEMATLGYQMANRSPIARIWFSLHLGRCAMLAGRPQTGRRWLVEARALCREYRWQIPHRLTLSTLAIVTAWLGDVTAARAAVHEQDGLGEFGFLRAEQDLGRAWAAAAAGNLPAARAIAVAAADLAGETGQLSSQALLLHDLARLGDPGRARDRLAELADQCEGALVPAYAAHASAAASDDPQGLVAAADRFEAIGAVLLAAETATEAAHAYQRRGESRSATALKVRAASLAARCEGAHTPGLVTAATVVPLTRREREIALLAGRGETSRRIAERLHVSVRTVDNHLQNAYTKLGVTGRDQLAAALAVAAGRPAVSLPSPRRPPRPSSPPR
jgi:DNA-binding CsgD family transcriptional regulator